MGKVRRTAYLVRGAADLQQDLAADEALHGEGEEDGEAEKEAGHVHEAV
jgi:hypothetical protein